MPGSTTTPGRERSCDDERSHVAFRLNHGVGAQKVIFEAQWPAYACPPTDASPSLSRATTHGLGSI